MHSFQLNETNAHLHIRNIVTNFLLFRAPEHRRREKRAMPPNNNSEENTKKIKKPLKQTSSPE